MDNAQQIDLAPVFFEILAKVKNYLRLIHLLGENPRSLCGHKRRTKFIFHLFLCCQCVKINLFLNGDLSESSILKFGLILRIDNAFSVVENDQEYIEKPFVFFGRKSINVSFRGH